jgi:hypothetical protein
MQSVPVPSVAARQGVSPNGQPHGPTSGVPAGMAGNQSTVWPGQL